MVTFLGVAVLIFQKPCLVNLYRNIEEDQKSRKQNINIAVLHELLSQSKIGGTIPVEFFSSHLACVKLAFFCLFAFQYSTIEWGESWDESLRV